MFKRKSKKVEEVVAVEEVKEDEPIKVEKKVVKKEIKKEEVTVVDKLVELANTNVR